MANGERGRGGGNRRSFSPIEYTSHVRPPFFFALAPKVLIRKVLMFTPTVLNLRKFTPRVSFCTFCVMKEDHLHLAVPAGGARGSTWAINHEHR